MKKSLFVVVAVLSFLFFSAPPASSEEIWSVAAYIEGTGSLNNQVIIESATNKAGSEMASQKCNQKKEDFQRSNSGGTAPECRVVGNCSVVGWMAVVSGVKSSGRAAVSCGEETEQKAVDKAKNSCGQFCAKIFTHEIKVPQKPAKKKRSEERKSLAHR